MADKKKHGNKKLADQLRKNVVGAADGVKDAVVEAPHSITEAVDATVDKAKDVGGDAKHLSGGIVQNATDTVQATADKIHLGQKSDKKGKKKNSKKHKKKQ